MVFSKPFWPPDPCSPQAQVLLEGVEPASIRVDIDVRRGRLIALLRDDIGVLIDVILNSSKGLSGIQAISTYSFIMANILEDAVFGISFIDIFISKRYS